MKNKAVLTIALVLFLFFHPGPALAATLSSGDISVTYDDPLFSSSTGWYPGKEVTKVISIKNTGSEKRTAGIIAANPESTGGGASVFLTRISGDGNDYFGGGKNKTLQDFWDAGPITLSDISSGSIVDYALTLSMPAKFGDTVQGAGAGFDLTVGFIGTDSQVGVHGGGPTLFTLANPAGLSPAPPNPPELLNNVPPQDRPVNQFGPEGLGETGKGKVLGSKTVKNASADFLIWAAIILGLLLLGLVFSWFFRRHRDKGLAQG